MKKRLVVMLVTCMIVSLVGCGNKDNTSELNNETSKSTTEESAEEMPQVSIGSALEILDSVWGQYEEADKFPVGGGDSANQNFEGPGTFDATNGEELDVTLGFPATQIEKIDDAASMMNAMMANNFTAGVYHVKYASEVQAVADALKENILSKQWMCGMPEKMVIVTVENYVISVFGLADSIDTFNEKLMETYETANVLYEESISQ